MMADKDLKKKGRGAYDYRSTNGIIAIKWFDNKCVTILSNACGVNPVASVQRWTWPRSACHAPHSLQHTMHF